MWDEELDGPVTVVSLKPEYMGKLEERSFRERAQLLANFDHPRSIEILAFENTGKDLRIVTETVDGVDLEAVIDEAAISVPDFEALVEDTLSWAVSWENYSDRDVVIEAVDVKVVWPSASVFVFIVCDLTLVGKTESGPAESGHPHLIASLMRLYRSALTGRLNDCATTDEGSTQNPAIREEELRQRRPDLPEHRVRWLAWAELPAAAGGPKSAEQARAQFYRAGDESNSNRAVANQTVTLDPAQAPAAVANTSANSDELDPLEDTAPIPLHLLEELVKSEPCGVSPAKGTKEDGSHRANITPIPLVVESRDAEPLAAGARSSESSISSENPTTPAREDRRRDPAEAAPQCSAGPRNVLSPRLASKPLAGKFRGYARSLTPVKIGIAASLAAGLLLAFLVLPLLNRTGHRHDSAMQEGQGQLPENAPPSDLQVHSGGPAAMPGLEPTPGQRHAPGAENAASSASPLPSLAAPENSVPENIAGAPAARLISGALALTVPAAAVSEARLQREGKIARSSGDAAAELSAIIEEVGQSGVAGLEVGPRESIVGRLAQLLQPAVGGQPLTSADIERAITACFSKSAEFSAGETELLELAASNFGSPSAARLMARQHRRSKGEAAALPWTLMAAEAGDIESMLAAGLFLMSAQGKSSPHAGEAVTWLRRAAEAGNRDGTYYFAECLLLGKGVSRDEAEAINWLTTADEAYGDARATDLLGVCFSKGLGGLAVDTERAAALFEKAVSRGNQSALANLAVLYLNGTGVEKNDARALELLQQGVEQNNPACLLIYARCHENGRGVEKDERKAQRWYRLAAEAGNRQARQHLK